MECDICGKSFRSLYYVARHKRQVHKMLSCPLKRGPQSDGKFICHFCNGNWTRRTNLRKHLMLAHGQISEPPVESTMACPYDFCQRVFRSKERTLAEKVRKHILREHSVGDVAFVEKHFTNMDEFREWKSYEENIERVKFTQNRGASKGVSKVVSHFYCNRSGNPRRKGKAARRLRIREPLKVGIFCPAKITATTDTNSGEVCVKYFNIHVAHDRDLIVDCDVKDLLPYKKTVREDSKILEDELVVHVISSPIFI